MPIFHRIIAVCLAVVAGFGLAASAGCSAPTAASARPADGRISVLASFYPLQFVAQEIGGDLVQVTNITPPAAEPHDLELSPAHVRQFATADLVVYLSGFQPAVDEAIKQRKPAHVVDAAASARLEVHPGEPTGPPGSGLGVEAKAATDAHVAARLAGLADQSSKGTNDPHFWLDPTRLAAVGQDVARELSNLDPAHAAQFAANAANLMDRLNRLDAQFAAALAPCRGALLVTNHEAFGYLAERYHLVQVSIVGIDPEAEPAPARLRAIGDLVSQTQVTTLFTEALLSSKVTQTLADDLRIRTERLDPLESLTVPGADYFSAMQANLAALTSGLECG